jgi:holdfast attachment protein HfaA
MRRGGDQIKGGAAIILNSRSLWHGGCFLAVTPRRWRGDKVKAVMIPTLPQATFRIVLAAVATAGLVTNAAAQSMNSNAAAYNAGYGRVADQENRAVAFGVRDANGNLVIVDGQIQTGVDQSGFSFAGAGGAIDTFAGVGASSTSTAIGNNLTVTTQGNYNTVIVSSQQTNTGNITAGTH